MFLMTMLLTKSSLQKVGIAQCIQGTLLALSAIPGDCSTVALVRPWNRLQQL